MAPRGPPVAPGMPFCCLESVQCDIALFVKEKQCEMQQKSETKGGLFEGKLLSQDEIKAIAALPSKEVLMAQIAQALNSITTKIAVGINEVPSGLARSLKQHADSGESQLLTI